MNINNIFLEACLYYILYSLYFCYSMYTIQPLLLIIFLPLERTDRHFIIVMPIVIHGVALCKIYILSIVYLLENLLL